MRQFGSELPDVILGDCVNHVYVDALALRFVICLGGVIEGSALAPRHRMQPGSRWSGRFRAVCWKALERRKHAHLEAITELVAADELRDLLLYQRNGES